MKTTNRILTMAAAATIATGGAIALDATHAPAANAACYSGLTYYKAKNGSCKPKMRHWDAIKNSKAKYAAWVTPGKWSIQGACWANIASYGVTVG